MEMKNVVKSCDLPGQVAAKLFVMLNRGNVELVDDCDVCVPYLSVKVNPKELVYPEGWYYAKGAFRNKHNSTTGLYDEILVEVCAEE